MITVEVDDNYIGRLARFSPTDSPIPSVLHRDRFPLGGEDRADLLLMGVGGTPVGSPSFRQGGSPRFLRGSPGISE